MVSILSHALPFISSSSPAESSGKENITDAPSIPRTLIGPAIDHLEGELVTMYWKGVERELPYILLTLRRWQSREETLALLPDEEDDHIHGYDTFLDQVSHSSRRFFKRNVRAGPPPKKKETPNGPPSYEEALQDRGWDMFADIKSQHIKESVRASLLSRKPLDPVRRRARMLLQSAQFLDIDKVIEYREPETALSFWKRPATPQMTVSSYDKRHMPIFVPKHCLECKSIIRGSMFHRVDAVESEATVVCESCYRKTHYNQPTFSKKLKECCLPAAITAEVSQKLCPCGSISRRDADGRLRALWPVNPELDGHLYGESGRVSCGLYGVTDLFSEAKYAATRLKIDKYRTLRQTKKKGGEEESWDEYWDEWPFMGIVRPPKLKMMDKPTMPEFGTSYGVTDESPEDIPLYLRSTTNKYPYGNVHTALRMGPIIIENGVAHTHRGVLITNRDPPNLQVLRDPPEDIKNCLLLTGPKNQSRTLYSQIRPRVPKRYKAFMKQVVGGAFCGFFNSDQEEDLIDALVEESHRFIDDGISFNQKEELLKQAGNRLVSKLKHYLGSRVQKYVSSIATQLLDPEMDLGWNFRSNNCQMFCDRLIDRDVFGAFLDAQTAATATAGRPAPLYLMSFICRPGAYIQTTTRSKFDVPNGLTEEYLLKFRYGRHDESDIIDTLSEYWYDWGGFEGPIYPYQDVFPWDCTEAYDRYPGKCSECNISKHVWAFPFDSWSIISLHLAKGRQLYPRHAFPKTASITKKHATGLMTDTDWFQNRLTVLLGQDVLLAAAAALAKCAPFRESTLWLHQQDDQKLDRLKLGGIHRAQPFSHHFEKGAYHQYFIADWAYLEKPLRIAEYEKLRDWKATQEDVGKASTSNKAGSGGGGGGSCGGFGCGATAATGCAATAVGTGHDGCGTGCVSSCGGGGGTGGCGGGGGGGGGCGGGGGGGGHRYSRCCPAILPNLAAMPAAGTATTNGTPNGQKHQQGSEESIGKIR
ncbi:hypothetical protein ACJZ2D_012235 [Fusarium nematophilum]